MSAHWTPDCDDLITLPNLLSGFDTIRTMRERSDKCLLAFSCGKDSIGAWLALRQEGMSVTPFYMYLIPELEFVESSLQYYESFFGQKILRLPHPSLYRMINNMVFTPPERCRIIEASSFPQFDYQDLMRGLREWLDIDDDTMTATGVRCADSINRRRHFVKHGSVNWSRKTFYPVWDLRIDGLLGLMRHYKVKVPIDYKIFGRSFDGIDYRFLAPIKQHFPNDFARILEYFPLAELELKRAEYAKNQETQTY